jgi:hypothetical protein
MPIPQFVKGKRPTWKDVFDGTKFPARVGIIKEAVGFILSTGYTAFTWNGRIYEIYESTYVDTGWAVEDLS